MKHDQIKWTKSNSIKSDKNENDQIKKGLNYERIIAQEKTFTSLKHLKINNILKSK